MMLFLALALAVLVVALAVFCFPWQGSGAVDRNTLNRIFYQSRLQELAQEKSGRDEMVVELQRNLLADIPQQSAPPPRPLSRWWLLPGALGLVIVSVGIFMRTSDIYQVVHLQQAERQFPALYRQAEDPNARPLSIAEMARLSLGLRAHLQSHPDFLAGWQMLGRLGLVLNDAGTAIGAFERAYQRSPQDRSVTLAYASVLVRAGDEGQVRQGELLLEDMFTSESANPAIMELLALSAWRQQHYQRAAEIWQQVLKTLPSDSPLRDALQRSMDEARKRAGSVEG